MSYSFSVTAATKEESTAKIREKFDDVVVAQPTHAADKEAAVVAAQTFVRLLAEPKDDEEIYVIVNGSLGWNYDQGMAPTEFLHADLNLNVSLRAKTK